MLDRLVELTATPPQGCEHVEARFVWRREQRLATRLGQVDELGDDEAEGVGVRVRAGAAWGFASTHDLSRTGLERSLARAVAVARAAPPGPASGLTPIVPARGHWAGPCRQDPFTVSLEDKLELLERADLALQGDPRIARTGATLRSVRTRTAFASSEGAACTQEHTTCGAGVEAIATRDGEVQQRSYPGRHGAGTVAGGFEQATDLRLAEHAPRVSEEAVALLSAPACAPGTGTIVLDGEQMALQLHESIGHALELDRMQGGEAAYAGTSWVSPSDLGSLTYGAPGLAVTADATLPGGLGSFGWDDEGVAARRLELIRGGVLLEALSSRESAAAAGLDASGGCMRADGPSRQPIVRMTNVSFEPGTAGTLEELIADTDDGIYMETNRSWSIDDRRLHFQFACELGREIRDGELRGLVRNPAYAGVTPRFWASLDGVCSAPEWRLWGVLNCGKGEPGQRMQVSHGTAPARFRGVSVGLA